MIAKNFHSSSFRDPSGYVFIEDGIIKRVIHPIYFEQYNKLTESGFFKVLFNNRLLIPHQELTYTNEQIVIQPNKVSFITYPYEWSFNQYKEAALLTLKLQKYSLEHGFSLKDASAFNITFHNGKAIFIDTLSFDFYAENSPWRAYKQFITHFLGPLVLSYFHGAQMLKLTSNFIDGIPVKMISSLLPFKTKLNPFLYSNIHLLAKLEEKHNEDYKGTSKKASLSKKAQLNIIESLYDYIKKLELKETSEWGKYYSKINYSDSAFILKSEIINCWIATMKPKTLIDIGGNDGTFVRRINYKIEETLVCDIDNNAVDYNYKTLKINKEQSMLPFVLDVLNPSAAIGLNNKERFSFLDRIKEYAPDVTLALAVIHHMTLSGNVPFDKSAQFFSSFSKYLIIEFPKREDSWVKRLLNNKAEFKEHFDFYNLEAFEKAYSKYFEIIENKAIDDSERVMYLLKNKC
ncbi:50S ribosomal protein L11 methyltransferase [Aquaticitalea lipolytica]|uniref:50S ribosomal protein L11 methyltransferase n=1 Tax=Aquaticitalea lipolytica TaxID=1247562 RepID=A0A8J2TP59_9FLAO|nr:class I SAM-dependent methyltransferase [Aquaticitalea lipolytica]GFZ78982.1 50S ribosomal protein L11 methyltransferase [Aquaticitalea lipolytica]